MRIWDIGFRIWDLESENGVRGKESGGRSQGAGVRSQESGGRSEGAGVRGQKSGVRSQWEEDGGRKY